MSHEHLIINDSDGNELILEMNEVFLNKRGELIKSDDWEEKQWEEVARQENRKLARSLDDKNNQKWRDYNELSKKDFQEKLKDVM